MKKKLTILFIVTLSLFAALQFALAAPFIGNVTGSTVGADGTGTVTVTGATSGATLTLYSDTNNVPITEQTATIFSSVRPGKYYVTATTTNEAGETVVSGPSQIATVKPKPVTISSTLGTNKIAVSGGDTDAIFTLYNNTIVGFTPIPIEANTNGSGVFENLQSGKGYQVRQTVNGVASDLSAQSITIQPNQVTVVLTNQSGPTNNQGAITVTGTVLGYTLSLYHGDGTLALPPAIVTSETGYIFNGLSAGVYYVVQSQNGINSVDSDRITLSDQEIPVITLNGANPIRVVYDPNGLNYTELGASVKDNIDPIKTLSQADNPLESGAFPGVYELKYNASDIAGNKATEVIRTVTIAPNVVTLVPKNTEQATPKGTANGEIVVNNVIPGAILYLYRDIDNDKNITNDNLVRIISQTNAKEIEIDDVPVGENYYVIQEYNKVQSDPSTRHDVEDKTRPELTLIGDPILELTVGDSYLEQGAKATDNVDATLTVIIGGTKVDTKKAGKYIITYNVTDKAGNVASEITRIVNVKPQPVTITGSTADMGTIDVINATASEPNLLTTLTLYKMKEDKNFEIIDTFDLPISETTHVFKKDEKYKPGSYYVTQTVNGFESRRSNIVDITDIDKPYITLKGSENLFYVLNESNRFIDPGATATDYIDGTITNKISTKLTKPDGSNENQTNDSTHDVTFEEPGVYTITYSVVAARGTKADDKQRTITVAPPKTITPTSEVGKSTITVPDPADPAIDGVYKHITTVIKLYNSYNQLIDSQTAKNVTTVTFTKVPAGLGYYVTQTVNGIESAPSDPVNVRLYPDAEAFVGFTSFTFKESITPAIINQSKGTITVTLPSGTSEDRLKSLMPQFTVTDGGTVTNDISIEGFTKPVTYIVSNSDNTKSKNYTVIVTVARSETSTWLNTIKKSVILTENQSQSFSLTATEKALAAGKGISFIATDKAIHVSAANIKESNTPILTVKDITNNSFVTTSDPSWKTKLSNILQIGWGGSNDPFLQPIEVELENLNNKKFVRLVRENNKLYAIVQPKSEPIGTKTVGLVTQPGVYALLDYVSPTAKIVTGTPTTYGLISNPSAASIFYTTTSTHLTFERSARDHDLTSYVFTGTPANLSANWNEYQNDKITPPADELYAVAMHDQIISPIQFIAPKPATDWPGDIQSVSRFKAWNIQVNESLDKKSLFSNSIYVTDDSTGDHVETILQLSDDGKTITVAPTIAYEIGKSYTLWIEKHIQESTSKKFLKQPIKMTFFIKK